MELPDSFISGRLKESNYFEIKYPETQDSLETGF
jgi:hypothetical protein